MDRHERTEQRGLQYSTVLQAQERLRKLYVTLNVLDLCGQPPMPRPVGKCDAMSQTLTEVGEKKTRS